MTDEMAWKIWWVYFIVLNVSVGLIVILFT